MPAACAALFAILLGSSLAAGAEVSSGSELIAAFQAYDPLIELSGFILYPTTGFRLSPVVAVNTTLAAVPGQPAVIDTSAGSDPAVLPVIVAPSVTLEISLGVVITPVQNFVSASGNEAFSVRGAFLVLTYHNAQLY